MDQAKPILFFTDSLSPGGAERQLVALLTRLDRSRFAPRVVSLHAARSGLSRHFAPALEEAHIPFEELDLCWNLRGVSDGLLRVIRAVRRHRPRLVHSLNHHSNHLTRLGRAFFPRGTRLIVGVRTDYNRRQLLYERIENRVADLVVCNSPHMVEKLRSGSRVPAAKLRLVPNGIEVERFGRNPEPGLRETLFPGATRVVAMLARITHQKSPHLLAEAVGRLRTQGRLPEGSRFVLAGERTPDEAGRLLDQALERDHLGDIFKVLPPTPEPEALYHAADFSVLATLWEGMPNAALESLAAGRPVLISSNANAAQVIEHDRTGWVVPTNDGPALAEQLAHVLSLSDEQLADMGSACREAGSAYSMSAMVEAYERLYDSLLS